MKKLGSVTRLVEEWQKGCYFFSEVVAKSSKGQWQDIDKDKSTNFYCPNDGLKIKCHTVSYDTHILMENVKNILDFYVL